MLDSIHFVLNGKGGCGKSFIASMITQYLRHQHAGDASMVQCVDTDPTNKTVSQFTDFEAKELDIVADDGNIDTRRFDDLYEITLNHPGPTVVDFGSSSFIPFTAYSCENDLFSTIQEYGRKLVLHVPVVGGQAANDTMDGLEHLLKTQNGPVVVWLNEFFGEIGNKSRGFFDTDLYRQYKDRIVGIVRLERGKERTTAEDIREMVARSITFARAVESPTFSIAARSRIKRVRDGVFGQLDQIRV